jgi:hypothetical protein
MTNMVQKSIHEHQNFNHWENRQQSVAIIN